MHYTDIKQSVRLFINMINFTCIRRVVLLALFLLAPLAQAETISVPLKVDFPLFRQLLVTQLFNGDLGSTELLNDPGQCSTIILSNPKLGELNQQLLINSRLSANLAIKMLDQCVSIFSWEGYAQIMAKPVIKHNNSRIIHLQITDSHLFNLENEQLTSGPLWDQARKHIHPLFEQFKLDLTPSINELKSFLPLFLTAHSKKQIDHLLDSIQLSDFTITKAGVSSELKFDIESLVQPVQKPEHVLTEQEQLQWQEKWQSMDALLTNSIKHYAAATELKDLRLTLFDILIDARYQLQYVLQQEQAEDPVRHWFVESWTKIIPVIRQISAEKPQHSTLALMTLITASDALKTLDTLGPSFGLDISIDGLRRLARLLNNAPDIDPLKYDEELDPELLRLFNFSQAIENKRPFTFNIWPVSNANAYSSPPLNNWIPTEDELDSYLSSVRQLLLTNAKQTTADSTLTNVQKEVFKKLVLTTAWQESCWRQYIVSDKKVVPLRSSTGDTGIMQINEKVWRGFVDIHKLRWDINYNVQSGNKILLNYMTRYALKNAEHKQPGGIDNLARSSYSTYNGGPGQVARYRSHHVKPELKKIDKKFNEKYLQVKQGNELAVGECLGKKQVRQAISSNKKRAIAPTIKTVTIANNNKRIIHDKKWIKQQKKHYLTLQLGVFSSHKSAFSFIQQQTQPGNYAVFQQYNKNPAIFTVIYGYYSNRKSAEKEQTRFKSVKSWIRPFQDIQKIIAH